MLHEKLKQVCMALGLLLCFFPALVGSAKAKELAVVKPSLACLSLAESDVRPAGGDPARIVSARVVMSGPVGPYCEVKGYVAPQVRFELRLPTENWTQRLMFSGCGGFCGRVDFRIRASEGCAAIDNGEIALVTSDLGHDAPDGNADTVWAARNRQGKIDYGYRGVHVVTIAAKAIIERYYGQRQAYAYFNGCSDGGREGLMEVQRYPEDFDGVVAGASVLHDTVNNTIFHVWNDRQSRGPDGTVLLRDPDLQTLHLAVLAACDEAGDGVKDGVVGNPEACRFDPASISCKEGQATNCLSSQQVAAVRALYTGPVDASGKPLYFGRSYGSELGWTVRDNADMAMGFIRYMASDDIIEMKPQDVRYDDISLAQFNRLAEVYNPTDSDIEAFRSRGGKLIMYHGWADPGVPPMSSVSYYRDVQARFGAKTDDFLRLFMLPGVGHCQGGEGPDKINLFDAIMAWVEDGIAPQSIVAARKVYGRTQLSRPIFPYPATAKFVGKGDASKSASFRAARPH